MGWIRERRMVKWDRRGDRGWNCVLDGGCSGFWKDGIRDRYWRRYGYDSK